jgi:CheY-like chemotaxis protein
MKAQQLPLSSPPVNLINMETKDDSLHFVVIDDDTINNMVCRAAIKSATGGKTAVCFNKPVDGLHYFENEYQSLDNSPPTILFLDINMPEMNGWEWLEKFSGFQQSIKEKLIIYILSSSVNPTDIDHAHSNYLVKDYIVKPLTKAKVLNLLEESTPRPAMKLKIV